jgi:hypothetical protein
MSPAWQMPTLDRQPFTTMDYKKKDKHQVVIVLGGTDAGASLSTRHLLLELLGKPP